MSFQQKLDQINTLQKRIDEAGKLPPEVLSQIQYKFRLDWNYYSNKMEGNTLTIEETKSVMVGNISVQNKPIKDVFEMQGHDQSIQLILQLGKGELNISEKRIKELHKAIMYEEKAANRDQIGSWKIVSNHVFNYRDEKYDFVQPAEVADEMHALINWVNAESEKISRGVSSALHPVQLAFDFHLRYLSIHPFYDGNGRTGRILTNLILIRHGFPPIYVKDDDKVIYYRYLADVQAYGADRTMLFEVMADYLIRSQQLVLAAIAGKPIADPDDLDKKLQLLEMELNALNTDEEVKMKYGKEAFLYTYDGWVRKLLAYTIPLIQKFNRFFTGVNHSISLAHTGVYLNFSDETVTDITLKLTQEIEEKMQRISDVRPEFIIQTHYGTLTKGGLKTFGCIYKLAVRYSEIKFDLFIDEFDENGGFEKHLFERLYHQSLSEPELREAADHLADTIFRHIDHHTRINGLRK